MLNWISFLTFLMVTFAGVPKFSYWDFRAAASSVSVLSLKRLFMFYHWAEYGSVRESAGTHVKLEDDV